MQRPLYLTAHDTPNRQHASDGIRTLNTTQREALDPRLRPRGHWEPSPRLRRRILSRNVIRLLCRKDNYKLYGTFQAFGSVRTAWRTLHLTFLNNVSKTNSCVNCPLWLQQCSTLLSASAMFARHKNVNSNRINADQWGINLLKGQKVCQCNYRLTGSETYRSYKFFFFFFISPLFILPVWGWPLVHVWINVQLGNYSVKLRSIPVNTLSLWSF